MYYQLIKSTCYYEQHMSRCTILSLEFAAVKRTGTSLMMPGSVMDLVETYILVIVGKCVASVMYCLKVDVVLCGFIFISVEPSALCMLPFGMCRPAWACGPHPISAVRVGVGEKTPPLQRPF